MKGWTPSVGDRVQQIYTIPTASGPVVHHGPSVKIVEIDRGGFLYIETPLTKQRVGPYPKQRFRPTSEQTMDEFEPPSPGDAKCGFCNGPMPCYCEKPKDWDKGIDPHGEQRISSDRSPL